MSVAFVCAKDDFGDDVHETTIVMRRCSRCDKHGVAGYECMTCGHEDLDDADRLTGHGEGKCEQVAILDGAA